jgi:5-methyltetrahydrofolate--homocysteine methyltransferase
MIVVGERINITRKQVYEAVENRNRDFVQEHIQKQVHTGANYFDINAATRLEKEMEDMNWLVDTIESDENELLSLDSPNSKVFAISKKVKKKPMINSTTAESPRLEGIKPILSERERDIVAFPMDERGIPKDADIALENTSLLVKNITALGVPLENIHIDPMVQAISVPEDNEVLALETSRRIHTEFPGIHTLCGFSNVSFGLPNRYLLNRVFLILCIGAGLTGAILDPLDSKIMTNIVVAETPMGCDPFCRNYLRTFRGGRLENS